MKNIRRTLFLIFLSLVCSCTNEFDEFSNVTAEDPMMVTAILPDWDLEDVETRTSITTGAYPTAPSPVWVAGDSIGIYPNAGGDQLSFRINEGGSKTCTFDGGGWAMTSASYTAYSPFKRSYYYEQKDALPISMLGQTQNGNDNADHLGAYDIQIATGEKPETGSLIFSFSRKVALVRLEITAPKAATWSSVSLESDALFTTDAIMNLDLETPAVTPVTTSNSVTLNLKNVSTTRDNLSIIAYMMLLPVDLTGKTLSVKLTDNEGNIYSKEASVTNNKTNFAANAARWVTADFKEETIPNNQIWYISNQEITPIYSGIETFGANIVSNEWDSVTGNGVITFDNEVTKIGDRAFSGYNTYCSQISSITIPNSVTAIGNWAFQYCENLTNFIIPNNVTIIGNGAFEQCCSLASVTIGDSVKEIGYSAFYSCESLTSVTIPDDVTTIGGNAFYACDKLESFKGKYAEDNGRVLIKDNKLISYANASGTSYTIPNYVTSIGECAFYYCGNLVSVTIPESVIIIEDDAFSECLGLKSVTIIGNNLTSIGYAAFAGCDYLESITLPNSVTDIMDMAFHWCKSLKSIRIPENVTAIKSQLFYRCSSITTLMIPKNVTSIESKAFSYCESMTSVIIPETVTTISNEAFYHCTSLTEAYVRAATPPSLGMEAFTNCSDNLTIYVPIESLDTYTSAYNWKNFNIEIIVKAVDLGLSVKWANCNLGANGPEEYGNYYAWGEINTKTDYTPDNSMSWNIPYNNCPLNSEGNLIFAWDAAYKTWGNSWRMPTKAELDELKNNCNWEWSTLNGVKGYTVTSKINGNSIFFPANDSSVIDSKETGFGSYWSSTPCSDTTFDSEGRYAGAIGFYAKDYNISESVRIQSDYFLRWCKRGIRPVYNE